MFHLRFFQSNVCLKTLLFALPKCLRLKLSYCLDISLEMSIFDKCVACAGRVYGERCNEESVRNKLLFFRGKLEEQRQAVNEWRCASVCGCWWQRGTCTHTHIIWCIYYIFIYVHVSSIKTCFDVLIIVQLLLYIYIHICISAIFIDFIVPIQIVSKTDASYWIIFMFSTNNSRWQENNGHTGCGFLVLFCTRDLHGLFWCAILWVEWLWMTQLLWL